MAESNQGTQNAGGTPPVSSTALQGGLSGLFVEFDHLPYLLANLDRPGRSGPDWPQVLHGIRAWMDELGVEWIDDLPDYPAVLMPSLEAAAEGARQLCERVGFIEAGAMTDSGRKVAALMELGRDTHRQLLAPILATGVESALVGQEGASLVHLLRGAAQRISDARSPWAQQCPGLLPVEVAAIGHWACIDIQRAHALARDIEINRDLAMAEEESPSDPEEADAEHTYEATTQFYMEHRDLLGPVSVGRGEILAPARLLAYCGLFEGTPVYAPYMEDFYLVSR